MSQRRIKTRFPHGETVSAYRREDQRPSSTGPSGAPRGTVVDSDTSELGTVTLDLPTGEFYLVCEVDTDVFEWSHAAYATDTVHADATANDTTTLVSGVPGKAIKVLSGLVVVGDTATTVTFQSDDGSSPLDISGPMDFGANGGISLPANATGHFTTRPGDDLIVDLSEGSNVGVGLTYALV